MAVRSKQLGHGVTVAATLMTVYTCPAGYSTIVKEATLFNGVGAGEQGGWFVLTASGTLVWLTYQTGVPLNGSIRWEGWQLLDPGDVLGCYANVASMPYLASGAELAGVAVP